jgi:esterase/lipase
MASDRKTFVYGYTDLLKVDIRDGLSKIASPVLILGASFPDKVTVTETFNKQYANLTNKTIEIASDSRHFIMWDQADWLYSKVNTFLAK